MIEVAHAPEHDRYEVCLDGEMVGRLDYRRGADGALHLTHAEVTPQVRGRGIGSALVRGALDDLADTGAQIVPECSFVHAFVRDNPDYQRLVA